MSNLIFMTVAALFLLFSGLALAEDDCRIVEFADHIEAVCTGDGKTVVQPEQKAAVTPPPPAETLTERPLQTAETPAKKDVAGETEKKQAPGPAPVLTHRQGRSNQASQSGLQDAISARKALIMEHNRQSEPAAEPAPVQ